MASHARTGAPVGCDNGVRAWYARMRREQKLSKCDRTRECWQSSVWERAEVAEMRTSKAELARVVKCDNARARGASVTSEIGESMIAVEGDRTREQGAEAACKNAESESKTCQTATTEAGSEQELPEFDRTRYQGAEEACESTENSQRGRKEKTRSYG